MISASELWTLTAACAAGGILGTIFFGGLWWTVRKGMASVLTGLWFFGSLMVRMSIALVGFYVVSAGHWERLLACLLGFAIARLIVSRWIKPGQGNPSQAAREDRYASHS